MQGGIRYDRNGMEELVRRNGESTDGRQNAQHETRGLDVGEAYPVEVQSVRE